MSKPRFNNKSQVPEHLKLHIIMRCIHRLVSNKYYSVLLFYYYYYYSIYHIEVVGSRVRVVYNQIDSR